MEKQCDKCGSMLQGGEKQCPNCGEPIRPPIVPTWLLVFFCIFFPPVGIYIIWKHTYILKSLKKKLTIAICIWMIPYAIIGLTSYNDSEDTEQKENIAEIENEDDIQDVSKDSPDKVEDKKPEKPSEKEDKFIEEKEKHVSKNKSSKELMKKATAGIMDFDYKIKKRKVMLENYNGSKKTLYIKPKYKIKGKTYRTDLSNFIVKSDDVNFLIICDGIKKINRPIFNSSNIHKVYFPKSIKKIYDSTLAYMDTEDQKIQVYYSGTKKEWNKIFTKYERKTLKDAWNSSDELEEKGSALGTALADKLNHFVGSDKYDSDRFKFHYSVKIKDLKL